ncbi:MAG TPA: BTAD domain-containing putative transcriptional regulator [Thermoleophilaceae bacterium]|nr:BTAD domain-containing putative transcriptional regulator [Thermoleophilaceae bacterium]
MQFRILGPLDVSEDDRRIDVGGPRQRALLALLLLNANEVVARDRLIDELWGEEPPASAVKTLQANVSRLRGSLNGGEGGRGNGAGRLETHGHGYLLRVEPGELDADRFRALLEEAKRDLARGYAGAASESLREGLGLWRGPPLADLSHDSFARAEIGRLDELRLAALEERIDADLALGRHAELVGELESLVDKHPLRERLRAQLMLALYRSDRQAEALRVYQDGRRALAEELGLEPSDSLRRLEGQILERDPSLAAPAAPRPGQPPPEQAPRRSRLVLISALVLAAAVIAAVFQLVREGGAESADDQANAPGARALDIRSGAEQASVPLGSSPSSIAVGEGAIWAIDAEDGTISRIDPRTRTRERTFSTASTPTDVAAGAGAVWVGNAFRGRASRGTYPKSVSRLDPETGVVDATITLPGADAHQYFQGGGFNQQRIAVTPTAVWVVNPDRTVSRIDPRTNRRVATIRDVQADDIAAAGDEVWVIASEGVIQINPRTNAVAQRIEVAAESMSALALGADSVWVADPIGGSVWRVFPGPDPVLRQIPLELGVRALAYGHGALWAANEVADKVYRIGPRTNEAKVVSRTIAPQRVAVARDAVWVTALGPPSGDESLLVSSCGRVAAGGARPRFLIVSDLPLQGPLRGYVSPMVDAVRFVLERREFKAGRYSVGYRSCDNSTAQAGGTDVFRCFSNAGAYARTPDVLGVIGSFFSFCSSLQIPIANQAPGGPLAMISPSNTVRGLTRPWPGMRPGELEKLYPTGQRNYARIAAADHLTPVALAETAQQLGATRVFVLRDRDDPDTAAGVAIETSPELGLEVAGSGTWDPAARRFTGLAGKVAAARPEAVLMNGAAPPHQGALIRDLRDALGPDVDLITSDGFADFPALISAAGKAAEGMYVGNYGVPNSKLPPAGRNFLDELERSGKGERGEDFTAAYGAQAAEILLDAIGRSDGTRASVSRELLRTRVEDGILGDIDFDRYGDPVEAPVTIYRIEGQEPVVDRVLMARSTPGR